MEMTTTDVPETPNPADPIDPPALLVATESATEETADVPPLDIPAPQAPTPEPAVSFVPDRPRSIPRDPKEKLKAAKKATILRAKLRSGKDITNDQRAWLTDYDGGHREYYAGGDLRRSRADSPHVPPLKMPMADKPSDGTRPSPEVVEATVMPAEPSKAKKQMAKSWAQKYGDFLKSANTASLAAAKEAGYATWPVVPDWLIDNLTIPAMQSYLEKSPILDKILETADDEQSQLAIVLGSGAATGLSFGAVKLVVASKKKKEATVKQAVERVNVIAAKPMDEREPNEDKPPMPAEEKQSLKAKGSVY